jgi:hypothetical protein
LIDWGGRIQRWHWWWWGVLRLLLYCFVCVMQFGESFLRAET